MPMPDISTLQKARLADGAAVWTDGAHYWYRAASAGDPTDGSEYYVNAPAVGREVTGPAIQGAATLQNGAPVTTTPTTASTPTSTATPTTTTTTTPTNTTTATSTTTTTGTQQQAAANSQTDAQFQTYLNGLNLPADQKAALTAIYNAVSTNDTAYAEKIQQAMSAATAYSDPYFKAQVNLVTDALSRNLQAKDGDLAFQQTQLNNSLNDLRDNLAASKDYLTFQQQQDLKQLEQKYTEDLDRTRTDMAALGKTSSSVRSHSEQLLGDNYNGMVESTNRAFNFKTGQMDAQLTGAQRDTALQLQNLQRLAALGKTDLLRTAENQVGSSALTGLGYTDVLGGVGGEIPRAQAQDALSFASNFVF